MIKKLHYVWLGGGRVPLAVKNCIKTWREKLPEWEIIRWDENNFNIEKYIWVKEAVEHKKYAFAADFIRLFVLYNYGGAYVDTDVQILRNIEDRITGDFVCGLLSPHIVSAEKIYNRLSIQTGFIYSEMKHPFIKTALEKIYWEGYKHFCKFDGTLETRPIDIELMTIMMDYYNIELKDETQYLNNNIVIYNSAVFASRKSKNSNSYLIHWFDQSWVDDIGIFKIKKLIKKYLFFLYRLQ